MKTCNVKGCTAPRYTSSSGQVYARCHEHMKLRWRRNKHQKHGDTKPRQLKHTNICPLCGRTPDQAALYAAEGVICLGCNTKPLKPARKVADKPARGGIMVAYPSYGDNQVQYLRAIIDHAEPMPATEGDLRQLMEQRADEGLLIARKVAW